MLAWEHSGFSVDASVRISLHDRDVPSSTKSLEHLVRYCARPAFALERLTVVAGRDDGPERIRYTLPRHKRGQWIGPGWQKKATAPDAQGVITLTPHEFLDRLAAPMPPPRKHRHRGTGGGSGHHRGSIFRLHVGHALLARDGIQLPTWGVGSTAPAAVREDEAIRTAEADCEQRVSKHLGAMTVLFVAIPDEPGPRSARVFIAFCTTNWPGNTRRRSTNGSTARNDGWPTTPPATSIAR
jgi:hypothetical protein